MLDVNRNVLSHIDTGVSVEMWGNWKNGRLVTARGPVSTSAIVDTFTNETVLDELSATFAINNNADASSLEITDVKLSFDSQAANIDQIMLSRDATSATETAWSAIQAKGGELPLELLSRLPASLLARIKPSQATQLLEANPQGRLLNWNIDIAQAFKRPAISMTANFEQIRSQSPLSPTVHTTQNRKPL